MMFKKSTAMLISLISRLKNSIPEITTKGMIVLGIDPGTIIMGYGVIESQDSDVSLIKYGALNTPSRSPIGERLSFLYGQILMRLSPNISPEAVAVEQPFVAKNAKSAFAIGRAQAVAILAAANSHIPCFEYTPAEIKQRVANYGASSKEQIQQMVMLQLGLTQIPEPADAADALAVALCHLQVTHLENLLNQIEAKMIAGVKGTIEAIGSNWVIVDVGGISFQVFVPTSTLSTLGCGGPSS